MPSYQAAEHLAGIGERLPQVAGLVFEAMYQALDEFVAVDQAAFDTVPQPTPKPLVLFFGALVVLFRGRTFADVFQELALVVLGPLLARLLAAKAHGRGFAGFPGDGDGARLRRGHGWLLRQGRMKLRQEQRQHQAQA